MAMTLGHPANMYTVLHHHHQQHSPPTTQNCVIVSGGMTPVTSKMSSVASVIQGKRPLAPAPERTSVLVTNNSDLRCKRKIQFIPYGGPPQQQQPASVARRNARERNRVKQVNNGFATLRQHIPPSVCAALSPTAAPTGGRGASKKLSKVETLRMAVEYIRSLQETIESHDMELSSNSGSENNRTDGSYYSINSPDSISSQQFSYPILLPTPSCSEASTSPTPSNGSDGFASAHSHHPSMHHNFTTQHEDNYENYDPNADDEELLDVIFSWQQE